MTEAAVYMDNTQRRVTRNPKEKKKGRKTEQERKNKESILSYAEV